MTNFTTNLRRKYVLQLFGAALDLAAYAAVSPSPAVIQRIVQGLWQFAITTELNALRLFSMVLGVEKEFMGLFRFATTAIKRTDTHDA